MYGWCKNCDDCNKPLYIQFHDDGATEGVYSALVKRGGVSTWNDWVYHVDDNESCGYNQRR